MIKSMTGFASLTREDEVVTVGVTARSVNHRYLDVQLRVPAHAQALEAAIRERVQQRLARGRVDMTVTTQLTVRPPVTVEIDTTLVAALVEAAERPEVGRATDGRWSVGELLRFPQVVRVSETPLEAATVARVETAVMAAVADAVAELERMREDEGDHLRADLAERLDAFDTLVGRLAAAAAAGDVTLRERLTARVADLAPEAAADPTTVAQEIVRFVARSDIHEELARLRAHVAHWGALVAGAEPCGRKLDFLLQEMNREVNTIGSKADGADTAALVVAAKAELEKLREQIQNVE